MNTFIGLTSGIAFGLMFTHLLPASLLMACVVAHIFFNKIGE